MAEELIIDLSNYKDRTGARVPEGTYRVQVEDAESGESRNKNPMVTVWLRIIGGEFDGQTLVDRLTLSDASMFRVVNFMQAIGLPTPKKRLKISLAQFRGKTLDVEVADGEPYNGRVKSEVRNYVRVQRASEPTAETVSDGFDEFMPEPEAPETDDLATDLPEPEPAAPAAVETDDEDDVPATVDLDSIEL